MIKDRTIFDMSWGQHEKGEMMKGKEKANKTLKEMMKEEKSCIIIEHCGFHGSFAIIGSIKKKNKHV